MGHADSNALPAVFSGKARPRRHPQGLKLPPRLPTCGSHVSAAEARYIYAARHSGPEGRHRTGSSLRGRAPCRLRSWRALVRHRLRMHVKVLISGSTPSAHWNHVGIGPCHHSWVISPTWAAILPGAAQRAASCNARSAPRQPDEEVDPGESREAARNTSFGIHTQ